MLALAYTLTLDDLVAFHLHHARTSPAAKRARSLVRAVLGLLLATLLSALGYAIRAPWPFFAVGAALWLWWFSRFHAGADRQLRAHLTRQQSEGRNLGVLGPHRFEVQEIFWAERTPWREVRTHVAAVERLVDATDHFFLYVSGDSAVILPKRAFETPAAAQSFFETLNQLRAAAPPVTGDPLPATTE